MIDWKVRFKNKTWLLSFSTLVISFIYNLLSMFDIVPKITQEEILNILSIIFNLFIGIGVVINPTTKGIRD